MAWQSTDNTYNDIREKSLSSWLDEMSEHEDIAVRGGVKLAREYMEHLKTENERLKREVELRNTYLRKIKAESLDNSKGI